MEMTTPTAKYLSYLVNEGATKKYGTPLPQDVVDRINLEMDVIVGNKFDDYILMLWDIHHFCKTPSRVREFCALKGITPPPDGIIPLGPGRGSAGGSIVCYFIGITECDPLLFGLFFERFLNPERIAMPDIDFDVSRRYRHIVLAYISNKYGEAHVAQIITYGTLSVKTVIHDVLQSAGISNASINIVKATVPEDPTITLADMEKNPKFIEALQAIYFNDTIVQVGPQDVKKVMNANPQYAEHIMPLLLGSTQPISVEVKTSWTWEKALFVMKRLEGLKKNESTHAAGVVVAPVELESNVPLLKKDEDGVLACQYDMRLLEALGYLKMDALGLRTVDVNHNAEMLVKKWYDESFSIRDVRYDDAETVKLINAGDTIGIFQVESSGFTQMMCDINIGGYEVPRYTDRQMEFITTIEKLRGLEIKDFMWISAGLALYRPGPLDAVIEGKTMVQHLIDRKAGREPVVYLFPEEKGYLEETYGVLVYQEQVMARVRQMTGCSLGRADILRKAMGKKDPVLMKEQMEWFEKSSIEYEFSANIPNKQQIVARAKEEIEKFARYGFNKAHTVEYGHICYHNAYFKAHYPVAYYTALLNSENDNAKRQMIIIRDMLNHNVTLLPPTVNESEAEFTMTDKNTIRFGLGAIKNVGERAMECIINERNRGGRFNTVEEFRIRIPATICNKTVMENLAKCGAFDDIMKTDCRATLVETMGGLCEAISKIAKKKNKNTPAPSVDEVMTKYRNGMVSYQTVQGEHDVIQYSVWEKEILKYYISAHPIDAFVDEMRRWNAIENTELEDLPKEFYIAGFIEGCHETVIKKEGRNKGKQMGFVSVGTAYRMYEATMFPGVYESCLPYIKTGNPVVLKGRRDEFNGKVTIQCIYIRNMTNSGIRDCPECHLYTDLEFSQLIQLKTAFDQYPGMTKVYIHTVDGYDDITIEVIMPIALNDYIIDMCESFGTLTYKPI